MFGRLHLAGSKGGPGRVSLHCNGVPSGGGALVQAHSGTALYGTLCGEGLPLITKGSATHHNSTGWSETKRKEFQSRNQEKQPVRNMNRNESTLRPLTITHTSATSRTEATSPPSPLAPSFRLALNCNSPCRGLLCAAFRRLHTLSTRCR